MRVRLAIVFLLLQLSLAAATPNLATIDFKNFEYPWYSTRGRASGWLGAARTRVQLKDGHHDFDPGEAQSAYLQFISVTRGDLDGDGQPEAAVDLLYSTGGTANWHYLYIFKDTEGGVAPLGVFQSGSRASGGLTGVHIEQQLLVVDLADGDRSQGECCSSGFIRVRYRFENGHFIETGEREKDSFRRVLGRLQSDSGPETVRQRLDGKRVNIVYTDSTGQEHDLTSSGINTEPNLSSNQRSVVYLRKTAQEQHEIWYVGTNGSGRKLLFRSALHWKNQTCPSSSIRSPQWSMNGQSVFFVTDCSDTSGALWRLDLRSRRVSPLIPEAVLYTVLRTGQYKGHIVANQRTAPEPNTPKDLRYPLYPYFLYTQEGEKLQQAGEDEEDFENVFKRWERR